MEINPIEPNIASIAITTISSVRVKALLECITIIGRGEKIITEN
jgi:hypothetical protein